MLSAHDVPGSSKQLAANILADFQLYSHQTVASLKYLPVPTHQNELSTKVENSHTDSQRGPSNIVKNLRPIDGSNGNILSEATPSANVSLDHDKNQFNSYLEYSHSDSNLYYPGGGQTQPVDFVPAVYDAQIGEIPAQNTVGYDEKGHLYKPTLEQQETTPDRDSLFLTSQSQNSPPLSEEVSYSPNAPHSFHDFHPSTSTMMPSLPSLEEALLAMNLGSAQDCQHQITPTNMPRLSAETFIPSSQQISNYLDDMDDTKKENLNYPNEFSQNCVEQFWQSSYHDSDSLSPALGDFTFPESRQKLSNNIISDVIEALVEQGPASIEKMAQLDNEDLTTVLKMLSGCGNEITIVKPCRYFLKGACHRSGT